MTPDVELENRCEGLELDARLSARQSAMRLVHIEEALHSAAIRARLWFAVGMWISAVLCLGGMALAAFAANSESQAAWGGLLTLVVSGTIVATAFAARSSSIVLGDQAAAVRREICSLWPGAEEGQGVMLIINRVREASGLRPRAGQHEP